MERNSHTVPSAAGPSKSGRDRVMKMMAMREIVRASRFPGGTATFSIGRYVHVDGRMKQWADGPHGAHNAACTK